MNANVADAVVDKELDDDASVLVDRVDPGSMPPL